MSQSDFVLGVLFGGPSDERSVSQNSARSFCDHVASEGIQLRRVCFSSTGHPYEVSERDMPQNTTDDYEHRFAGEDSNSRILDLEPWLKDCDLIMLAGHGRFFEDGKIQETLENMEVPFVGSCSEVCRQVFDKFEFSIAPALGELGIPSFLIDIEGLDDQQARDSALDNYERDLENWAKSRRCVNHMIVKPALGGSSIGVSRACTASKAIKAARKLYKGGYSRIVVQPDLKAGEKGALPTEFTVILVENPDGQPVALVPTEISCDDIFSYHKKYFPTNERQFFCPPSFGDEITQRIRRHAEDLFRKLNLRDFARIDGWVLRNEDIKFSDCNVISGLEQNSFLFLQAAHCGFDHQEFLHHLITSACSRRNIRCDLREDTPSQQPRRQVQVLFGGATSERQIAVQSGTNVWQKLRSSAEFEPHPYLLFEDNEGGRAVWSLPYAYALYHTVEEIGRVCNEASTIERRLAQLRAEIWQALGQRPCGAASQAQLPEKLTWEEFLARCKSSMAIVFSTVHGGEGEDGTLQSEFEAHGLLYNGSGPAASRLCMDKNATKERIRKLNIEGVGTALSRLYNWADLCDLRLSQVESVWSELQDTLKSDSIIVKPNADGCSTGVVRLANADELFSYLKFVKNGAGQIPPERKFTFQGEAKIEMPAVTPDSFLFEQFVDTAEVRPKQGKLKIRPNNWRVAQPWIEITVAVIGPEGAMRALNPSLTICSEGTNLLSVEDKFQGGTGVNLTPPPREIVSREFVDRARCGITRLANALGLRGFARIDAFLDCTTGDLLVIEVNTLPGMTASTVLFHQGLAETPPVPPLELIELIIRASHETEDAGDPGGLA